MKKIILNFPNEITRLFGKEFGKGNLYSSNKR